jgi:hypothetical protein
MIFKPKLIRIPETRHEGMPLGWHRPKFDKMSVAFPAPRAAVLKAVTHVHTGPVLNQGQTGSCTGQDTADCLNTEPLSNPKMTYTEQSALEVYGLAEEILGGEGYPPEDNGATNAAAARAAVRMGYATGWTYALDFNHFLAALVLQPVMYASYWYEEMFTPSPEGQVMPRGQVAGGHSYEADGLDPIREMVWFQNSWGTGWGVKGRFWMSFAAAKTLFEPGEVIALHTAPTVGIRQRTRLHRLPWGP